MIFHSTMSCTNLTNLPIDLQSHILSTVSNIPLFSSKPPSVCTIETSTFPLECFPDELLCAAQASNTLLDAVIGALGPHSNILNFHRSKRLPEWIPLLKKHIKALGLTGSSVLGPCVCEEVVCQCDHVYKGILETLKAIHTNKVELIALNFEELEVTNPDRAEEIGGHVARVIQKSSHSLQEIAVNINSASAFTTGLISGVSLPKLKIIQISSDDNEEDEQAAAMDLSCIAKKFGDVLVGFNGLSDRNVGIGNVEELRLYGMDEPPKVDSRDCLRLFPAVKKLVIMCGKNSKHGEIAKFIANFRNLQTLFWFTGLVCHKDMSTIFAGCAHLENLDLSISDGRIVPGDIDLTQSSSKLKELFRSFRGKARNLDFNACLSCVQLRDLGEYNPNLQVLDMELDTRNVQALALLLGTHCRKLRDLRLFYSKNEINCLGDAGWSAFAKAICSASNELQRISLVGDSKGALLESATDEMTLAITDILEFLGDRAISIIFRVPINTRDPFVVLKVLCRTLYVAHAHCSSIENLCLDFLKHHSLGGYQVEELQENDLLDLFLKVSERQDQFVLCGEGGEVNIGNIDALWEQEEMEDLLQV